jgi:four helix bundle protein
VNEKLCIRKGSCVSGSYRDLTAWKKSIDFVVDIYAFTREFPKDEQYGLTAQLRRAAVSVASNIAEGKGRSTDKELVLFLHHALGSLCEIETQLTIAKRLGFSSDNDSTRLSEAASELGKILNGLINALNRAIAA